MRFNLGHEVDVDLGIKEMLIAVGIAIVLFGGLAAFKALLMMI